MPFRQPQQSGSPKSECGSVVRTMFFSSTLISTPGLLETKKRGILRAHPRLLFRDLPLLGVPFGNRIGPVARRCTVSWRSRSLHSLVLDVATFSVLDVATFSLNISLRFACCG